MFEFEREGDALMFNADMDHFFDLAFERERVGTMTIEEIGKLFASKLTDWQIVESYADEDWRFMEWLETQLDEIEDGWIEVEEHLVRRCSAREKRRLRGNK